MGFIIGMGFEVMIDIMDIEGDLEFGVRTIAGIFSPKTAALTSAFFYSVIMILDPLPFFINIDSAFYHDSIFLSMVLVPVILY